MKFYLHANLHFLYDEASRLFNILMWLDVTKPCLVKMIASYKYAYLE